MGVQLGFMGVQLGGKVIWAGSRGPRLRCGNFRAAAGGCHPACQMMERRGADAAVRSWPAARFRLTAIIVSAGQVLGLVMRPGRRRRYSPAECRPGRPLSCYLGLVIDHRFGDVPLEWVFKSPLGHDGLPTELAVSYRQNCGGDRFLLWPRGLTLALAAVRGLLPGAAAGLRRSGGSAAWLRPAGWCWWVVAVGLRDVSRLGGGRGGWRGAAVPGGRCWPCRGR